MLDHKDNKRGEGKGPDSQTGKEKESALWRLSICIFLTCIRILLLSPYPLKQEGGQTGGCSKSDEREDKFYIVQAQWSQNIAVCSSGKLHLTSKLSFCNSCLHFCILSCCWQQGQMPHVIQYSPCAQVPLLRNQVLFLLSCSAEKFEFICCTAVLVSNI